MIKYWLITRIEKIIQWALFGIAFGYYYALSSKIFTWIYTSGDAGDWLVQLNWWMTPQCWGKPLYTLLIHAISPLPGDDVMKITMISVIAGAFMVMLTYLIAVKLTGSLKLGIIAALVVMGCNIILSQATVLEQYTVLGALFLAFFYFYIQDKLAIAAVFIGLTTAVHELGLVFTGLYVFIEWKRIKTILRYTPIYLACGLLPYAVTLWTMVSPDTPKLLAGFLSLDGLNAYGGNTTVTAGLALTEAPARLKEVAMVLITGLGFALIPSLLGLKKPWDTKTKLILATFGFSMWFYVTNLFPSTWKFLVPTLPLIICLGMVALQKLPRWQTQIVTFGAIALIFVNSFQFNSNVLAHEKPLAVNYYSDLWELPDGAAIITPRGGQYGFSIFYAMSEGKDLIPLALRKPDDGWLTAENNAAYVDYLWWLNKNYGIDGDNTYEIVKDALDKRIPVYFSHPMTKVWEAAFVYEDNEQGWLYRVTGVRKYPLFPDTSVEYNKFDDFWKLGGDDES